MKFDTPTRTRRGFTREVLLLPFVTAAIPAVPSKAQDRGGTAIKDEERRKLAEMEGIARGYRVSVIDEKDNRSPAAIVGEPLHRWTDPTREFSGGALWAFRSSGRTVAIYGLELYGTSWSHEFVSLTTGRLIADEGPVRWAPSKGGVAFREVPDAPAPAADEAGRLRQLRELARRFAAREIWDRQTYALRLLPHPIDRYADPRSGLLDGAIFAYTNGTNPELLLLLEARRRGDGALAWWCAAARFARAELHLTLNRREVWSAPILDKDLILNPDDSYYTTLTPRRGAAAAEAVRRFLEGLRKP